jgi:hypothetical protein
MSQAGIVFIIFLTEFSIAFHNPIPPYILYGITVRPDGNYWLSLYGGCQLGYLTDA